LDEHVLHPDATVQIIKREVTGAAGKGADVVWQVFEPLASRLVLALYASNDAMVLVFAAVTILVVVQILNMMRRVVEFWTKLIFRALLWAIVVALVAVIWQRGLEATFRDAAVIGSKTVGFLVRLKDVFLQEYERYEAQEKARQHASSSRRHR
jgi:hypothetical protein